MTKPAEHPVPDRPTPDHHPGADPDKGKPDQTTQDDSGGTGNGPPPGVGGG